ncbi:YfbU family protein [Pseudomonas cichorii]|uniref:YfbU family protein n=1 Tax=Pseudomonas cichorii TaxID=36746 RepID=UPI001C89FACF|nr:YfbU family protein [Pseudomonas cichorii]MBX8484037.1 YfbU family protein [Pseudomonas cichorii]
MEFTNQQKLTITLLADIHEKLGVQGSVDPGFVRRAVNENQGWALKWRYPGIFEDSGENPAEVGYVADVLEMWSVLESSFETLGATDRKKLEKAAGPFGREVRFPGFDGNHEYKHLAIARIFVNDLDRWSEFNGRIPNSHTNTEGRYRRMLTEFTEIREQKNNIHDYSLFDVDEITRVLKS